MQGRVRQVNVSDGGVPKLPVACAEVTVIGVTGDRQRDQKHHGGPSRAVCLYSWEVIERLRSEGHPIAPGTVGENVTVQGVDWSRVGPGSRFVFEGGVELEVTGFTEPCATIRESFLELGFRRIKQELHPGESRVYARVIQDGTIRSGENFHVEVAEGERHTMRP